MDPNFEKWTRYIETRGDPQFAIEERAAESANGDDGRMVISGYAVKYDEPTVIYTANGGNYTEVIRRGAFEGTRFNRCCLRYNHDRNGLVLARTKGDSLVLNADDVGLHFRATLFNTTAARDVYEVIREGGLDEMSFAFLVNKTDPDCVEYDRTTRTRSIKRIRELLDVSVVDNPAYETGTSVAIEARSAFSAEADADDADALKRAEAFDAISRKIKRYRMEVKINANR